MSPTDPLLQPYRLKHLMLRNRFMSTAHEPAYTEDGMPKERYRLYHEEKAKGGIALTMIGGSSVVSQDSPQAFGDLYDARLTEARREQEQYRTEHPGRAIAANVVGGLSVAPAKAHEEISARINDTPAMFLIMDLIVFINRMI